MFEVEMKFRVDDPIALEARLGALGIRFSAEVEERDVFYRHPSRDFGKTDEGLRLRLRRDDQGREERFLTYKGPRLDDRTKTRREIEIVVGNDPWPSLLEALGFTEAGTVHKFRRCSRYRFEERSFAILFDRLPDLPGRYVEIESVVGEDETSEDGTPEMESVRASLLRLADALELANPVRTSYFSLVRHGKRAENIQNILETR